MSAQSCQICRKSLRQDFDYCSKFCKKQAKARRKGKKRDLEEKIPLEIEVWVEECSPPPPTQSQEPSQKTLASSSSSSKISLRRSHWAQGRSLTSQEKSALAKAVDSVPVDTLSKARHMLTSENSFKNFLALLEENYENLKQMTEEDIANYVLQYVQFGLESGHNKSTPRPQYAVESFRFTYLPNLFEVFLRDGILFNKDTLQKQISNKISLMKKSKQIASKQMPLQSGANPFTIYDLEYVLQNTPKAIKNYIEIMAYLALAVNSGQRGISLINLKWDDVFVQKLLPGQEPSIVVTWVRGKGNLNWNHTQTLSGSTTQFGKSPLYWLEQLWKLQENNIAASILEKGWNSQRKPSYVFQLAGKLDEQFRESPQAESYRLVMQRITTYCGYPVNFFSNHSTRSGCQISLYLMKRAQSGGDSEDAIWSDIALYLGYTPKSKDQAAYFRNNFRSCLQLNRVLLAESKKVQTIDILRFQDIAVFHKLEECEMKILWTAPDHYECIASEIRKHFAKICQNGKVQLEWCLQKFWKQFHDQNFKSSETFKKLSQQHFKSLSGNLASKQMQQAKRVVSLKALSQIWLKKWEKNQVPLWKSSQDFIAKHSKWMLRCSKSHVVTQRPHKQARKNSLISKPNRRNLRALQRQKGALEEKKAALQHQREVEHYEQNLAAQQQRAATAKKRILWTPAETTLLCKLVIQHGAQWATICKEFDNRSNINCKDRMRTLAQQLNLEDGSPILAAKWWLDEYKEGEEKE